MNPIVYAIPVFMASIFLEALLSWHKKRATYNVADAITSLHLGVLSQVSGVFLSVLSIGIYTLAYEHARISSWSTDSLPLWLLALLFYDFCYYWVHRCGHEWNLMWAAHQVHHSSEYYNLSTALRQSSTTTFWAWPFYLPMAVVGISPLMFATVALVDLLYQYWVHTELVGKLGWFDRVFVSPSNHRVHHGQNDYCIDKNYGGILVIWDRVFNTFVEERDDEKIAYGVRKPLASYNPIYANFNVYLDILAQMHAEKSWLKKIILWFSPPGGRGVPVPHLETDKLHRFNARPARATQIYATVHYTLMVGYVSHFLAVSKTLTNHLLVAYAVLIAFAAFTLARLLENRRFAVGLEGIRLIVFGALIFSGTWFELTLPVVLKILLLVLFFCSSLFVLRCYVKPTSA